MRNLIPRSISNLAKLTFRPMRKFFTGSTLKVVTIDTIT